MLDNSERNKLQVILKDDFLMRVINKVFDEVIEAGKPIVSPNDTDEMLGQKFRACEMAKEFLSKGFEALHNYEEQMTSKPKFNKER